MALIALKFDCWLLQALGAASGIAEGAKSSAVKVGEWNGLVMAFVGVARGPRFSMKNGSGCTTGTSVIGESCTELAIWYI